MTELAEALADYLALRRSLGYKLERSSKELVRFVLFVEAHGARHLSTDLALRWAVATSNPHSGWRRQRLGFVRCFARYLRSIDPRHEVPPTRLLPPGPGRPAPVLYSREQVVALMGAARRLTSPLRAATLETVIGLLAVTGLRVGEVLALDRSDLDVDTGTLLVRNAKGNRSRIVPLHPSSLDALAGYLAVRDRFVTAPEERSFFVSTAATRVTSASLRRAFAEATALAGESLRGHGRRPRLGDFRHTFAVATLLEWHEMGRDVTSMLPVLSSFLGHVSPASTYWYFSASPELLAAAAGRLEVHLGRRP